MILLWTAANPSFADVTIDASGLPNYSFAIEVPPGVNGVQPHLSLDYVPGTPISSLATGWSMGGVSAITRCAASYRTDGFLQGVAYTTNDKLCLDGQRLIPLTSSGAAKVGRSQGDAAGSASGFYTQYQTISNSFALIRSYGYADGASAASGPAYFRIWTKDGKILEYGTGPASDGNTNALIKAFYPPAQTLHYAKGWMIARQSDIFGNYADYKYTQSDVAFGASSTYSSSGYGHQILLTEIQYSGNKVDFAYTIRAASSPQETTESYNGGSKYVTASRLSSITTYTNSPNTTAIGPAVGAVAVASTNLTYTPSTTTGRPLLNSIQTCAGAASSPRCLPAESLSYSVGGSDAYSPVSAFNLGSTSLMNPAGTMGVLLGDFNGDGRTDFISLGATNSLYLSNGDGSFTKAANFNLSSTVLAASSGCVKTYVADFNGDGLPDLLRYSAPGLSPDGSSSCGGTYGVSQLFINNGDGTFTAHNISGPTLASVVQFTTNYGGSTFYFLDVDGDGILDIITATTPAITSNTNPCASTVCTQVWKGNGLGGFTSIPTNLANRSLYVNPVAGLQAAIVDIDGDGLMDIVFGGNLGEGANANYYATMYAVRSHGDGNFDILPPGVAAAPSTLGYSAALAPLDFNGDGQTGFLVTGNAASGPAGNRLYVVDGPAGAANLVTNFNLTGSADDLEATSGVAIADINGDGRDDIIRWAKLPANNALFKSNGDGTFTQSTSFNFTGVQLQDFTSTTQFFVGNFTGHGNSDILRLQTTSQGVVSNVLYSKSNQTPPDLLIGATNSSGSTEQLVYVPLTNPTFAGNTLGPRYKTDRGSDTIVAPLIDAIPPPQYVVAQHLRDSGVGSTKLTDDYVYTGLKTDTLSILSAGYRDIQVQTIGAAGGFMTLDRQFIQNYPYTGDVLSSALYHAGIGSTSSSNLLSSTQNVYCDGTLGPSAGTSAASSHTNCATSSVIFNPYKVWSQTLAYDLNGVQFPTKTAQTLVTADSAPSSIVTTISTRAASAVTTQTFSYFADNTSCTDYQTCLWILARASSVSTESSVPSGISTTSSGSGPNATATTGTLPTSGAALTSSLSFGSVEANYGTAQQSATLSNNGVNPITVTAPNAGSVTGAGFAWVSSNCPASLAPAAQCEIVVSFSPTVAGSAGGTLSVVTSLGNLTSALSGNGAVPTYSLPALGFGAVASGGSANGVATLSNTGSLPLVVTAPTSGSVAGTGFSFVSSTCGGTLGSGGSCSATIGFAPTTNGNFSGTLSILTNAGTAAAALSGSGATPVVTVSPVAFGTIPANTTASANSTITNSGSVPATLTAPNASSVAGTAFTFLSSTCSGILNPGATCTVAVQFAPTAASSYSGLVQIVTNGGTYTNNLSGAGTLGSGTLSPLSFGNVVKGSSSTMYTALKNTGSTTLGLTVPTASSVSGAGFTFASTSCTSSLAVNATCSIGVKFSPTAVQAYSGTVTVSTAAGPISAALSGAGIAFASYSPASGTTLNVESDAQCGGGYDITNATILVQAIGTEKITLSDGNSTFITNTLSCGSNPATITDSSCTITVAPNVSSQGASTATLTVTTTSGQTGTFPITVSNNPASGCGGGN